MVMMCLASIVKFENSNAATDKVVDETHFAVSPAIEAMHVSNHFKLILVIC